MGPNTVLSLSIIRFIELRQQSIAQGKSSEAATQFALRALRSGGKKVRQRTERDHQDNVDIQDSMQPLKGLLSQLTHKAG